jgi:hypothetical protein
MHAAPSSRTHSFRLLRCLGAIFLLICLPGCATAGPDGSKPKKPFLAANSTPLNTAGLSPNDITQGAKLHIAKCARCHKFYDPAAYSDADWHLWMHKMAKKAKLTPDQEAVLSRYLEAFRVPRP